jgi:hypothetical protein
MAQPCNQSNSRAARWPMWADENRRPFRLFKGAYQEGNLVMFPVEIAIQLFAAGTYISLE